MTESEIFVFGDSLSDTGNSFNFTGGLIPPAPLYFNGRFSNGKVAVEILASQLSPAFTLEPVNNFAFGGATTGRGNSNEDDLGVDLPGLRDQIDAFAVKVGPSGADKNGLYIVWAGPNNFLDTLGGTTVADPAGLIRQGALDLTYAATTLKSLGAENIVLPNMVNLGRLPVSQGFQVEATAISKAFNAAVALELGNLNNDVTEVDLFATGEAVATNPASFGFSNVADPLLPLQFSSTPPSNQEEFFFWDQFHPTTQGHAVLADTIYQTITGEIPQLSFNSISGSGNNDVLVGTLANDNIDGFSGSDILIGQNGTDRIEGWKGNDLLFGNQGDDILSGGDGADSFWGGRGSDVSFGGGENDWLFGQSGDDILIGDGGNDLIGGGQGNDCLLGGEGRDSIWGNKGKDILNGGIGKDVVFGGLGDDRLDGGADDDFLIGGQGSDQFVYRLGSERDKIIDFNKGHDRIDLTSFGFTGFANFTSSVSLNSNIINFGDRNTLQLIGADVSSLSESNFIFS
jgi:phospholipase/lecithinase/hemolysin